MWYISFAGGAHGVSNLRVYHDSLSQILVYATDENGAPAQMFAYNCRERFAACHVS
jgi:hypothetical protein